VRETPAQAVVALTDLVATRLNLSPGQSICDIGCGYGASSRHLAAKHGLHVTGITVSAAQAAHAQPLNAAIGSDVSVRVEDFLANSLAGQSFDAAYAIESSEHMPDKQRFFAEAFRILKPSGQLVICAWLAADAPKPWETRHLLEPICREGRLPGMGDEVDYRAMAAKAGFQVLAVDDISAQVSRTWWICIRRFAARLVTRPSYLRFLMGGNNPNRIFAATIFRLALAYRTKAMRYCVFTLAKA